MEHLNEESAISDLSSHTLESLCDELVSGRAVSFGNGEVCRLDTPESRAIFSWYLSNKAKWRGNVSRDDVESIVDAAGESPSPPLPSSNAQHGTGIIWHLMRICAHQFGGLHLHSDACGPLSEDFVLDIGKGITVLEGKNGAGKTSILSAICWCLTGRGLRTQQPPTEIHQSIEVTVETNADSSGLRTAYVTIPAAPIPAASALSSILGGKAQLTVDTWVELSFCNDTNGDVVKVRRQVERTGSGRLKMSISGLDALRVDPVALEMGTTFPGSVPYIKLDESSSLGEAVSKLTGIQPLRDAARHARKTVAKLKVDFQKERQVSIAGARQKFVSAKTAIENVLAEYPELDPGIVITDVSDRVAAADTAEKLRQHFEQLETTRLAQTPLLVGSGFDPRNATSRGELARSVGPAIAALQAKNTLPNAVRLQRLGRLTDEEIKSANMLLGEIVAEAKTLEHESSRSAAPRRRLLARIVRWHNEEGKAIDAAATCPVCFRPLEGVTDPTTGRRVIEDIRSLTNVGVLAEQTVDGWIRAATNRLNNELPESVRAELSLDLPDSPLDLIRRAYCDDLFLVPSFTGCLSSLREIAVEHCNRHLASSRFSAFVEPDVDRLPVVVVSKSSELQRKIRRARRAIAFAEWRRSNGESCAAAYLSIVGREDSFKGGVERLDTDVAEWSLLRRLLGAQSAMSSSAPLRAVSAQVAFLRANVDSVAAEEIRLNSYVVAARALSLIEEFEHLVDSQVESTVKKLSADAMRWHRQMYSRDTMGGPEVVSTSVDGAGLMKILASYRGASVEARHVINSSGLRATLLSFLFALREHTVGARGGLSLILLDDPQELFDGSNRRRLAESIVSLLSENCRPIVATSNARLVSEIDAAARMQSGGEAVREVARLAIHACGGLRAVTTLTPQSSTIERMRRDFLDNVNDDNVARAYALHFRIWLEEQFFDFFESDDLSQQRKPSLSDLIGELRHRAAGGLEPFSNRSFKKLYDDSALSQGSKLHVVLNESHHEGGRNTSYGDVVGVSKDMERVRSSAMLAREDYDRHLRRDPVEEDVVVPDSPPAMTLPFVNVPVFRGIAALFDPTREAEVIDEGETFDSTWFESKAIYRLRTHNLGFSAKINDFVIANLNRSNSEDGRVFVALCVNRVLARRVYRDKERVGQVVLASETENPIKRAQTLIVPATSVRLQKIVGVIFDDGLPPEKSTRDEAVLYSKSLQMLDRITAVVSVSRSEELGSSAVPLALPGQRLLLGSDILPADIESHVGKYVVLYTQGTAMFKCIGAAIVGMPHVRMFDAVGGRGASLLMRTEDVGDGFMETLPLILGMKSVIGVIYPQ